MTQPLRVSDMKPGCIAVTVDGHIWRIGNLASPSPEGTHRLCRMLRDDLSETQHVAYLPPRLGVRDVLRERSEKQEPGQETDPVRGGMR